MSLNTILATAPLTTQNYVLKATGTALGNSIIYDNGSNAIGLGVTPSAWISTAKALQLGNTASLFAPSSEAILGNNIFVDSTDNNKYITTNFASQYRQVNGQHLFYNAPSGTAGNTITFTNVFNIANSGAATFAGSGNGIPLIIQDISAAITSQTAGYIGMSTSAFSGNNGDLVLYPRTSATSKILLMGGDVGIGTSSPAKTLDVFSSNNNATAQIKVKSTGNTSAGYFGVFSNQLYISAGGTYDSGWIIDGTNGITNIVMETSNGGSAIGFGTANSNTTASERMRITSAGNVGIGTSTPSGKLQIEAGVSTDSAPHILLGGNGYSGFHWMNNTAYYIGQNSQGRDVRVYSGNNTAVGVALTPNATSWTSYSDERLKTNIENFDSVLENILSLRTIKYHFKDVDEQDSQKRYGLVAQDLVGKFDEVLSKSKFSENDDTEYLGVRYTELIPVLVKALQEQQIQIQNLQEQINILAK